MKRRELLPNDPYKIRRIFLKELGYRGVSYIEKDNEITYYRDKTDFNLEFSYENRLVIVCIPIKRESRQVSVQFYFEMKLWLSLYKKLLVWLAIEKQSSVFYETKPALQDSTLTFLRYFMNWATAVSPDCDIVIDPTTQRRKRLYEFLARKYPNVIVLEADHNDLKSSNSQF